MSEKSRALKVLGVSCLAGIAQVAAAQQPEPDWVRHYNGPAWRNDGATMVALGSGGSVHVVGSSEDSQGAEDIVTIRYSASGDETWVRRYDNALNGIDEPRGIGVDDAGNTYVTGVSWGGNRFSGGSDWDYVTLKYDPDGTELWTRRYDGHGNWADTPESMVVDGAGNVYIAGFSLKEPDQLGRYATHFHVLKYDANGDMAWEYLFDLPQHLGAGARDVRLHPSGDVLATGIVNAGDLHNAQDDVHTVRLSPDTGQLVWEAQYDSGGSLPGLDDGFHVRTDPAGDVYVIGSVFTATGNRNFDTLLVKYSSSGAMLWERKMDFDRADGAGELAFDARGNVYMSGSWDNQTDPDGYVVSFTSSGQERWRSIYDGSSEYDFQEALAIFLAPDGDLYIGLDWQYDDPRGFDYTIVRQGVDGTFKEQWRFDAGSESDTFTSLGGLAMDERGDIYIAAYSSYPTTLADFTTMKIPAGAACYADCDGSGVLDVFDFICFQDAFVSGDPYADCTGDAALDIFDFLCFQDAFVAGCP